MCWVWVLLILAAADKKDPGHGILSWRPSVFSLNLGKRDRTDSGESRVTVSSIYSTSTVSSLAESAIKARTKIICIKTGSGVAIKNVWTHFCPKHNAGLHIFHFFMNIFFVIHICMYLGNMWRNLSSSWPCGKEENVWHWNRDLGQESEEWGWSHQELSSAQASCEVKSRESDNVLIISQFYVLVSSSCPDYDHKQQEKKEKRVKWHFIAPTLLFLLSNWSKHLIKKYRFLQNYIILFTIEQNSWKWNIKVRCLSKIFCCIHSSSESREYCTVADIKSHSLNLSFCSTLVLSDKCSINYW